MKFNTTILLAIVVFVIIILSTACGCSKFVPYNSAGAFSKEYAYEGFDTVHNPTEYSTKTVHGALDTYNSFLISRDADACKKIYGFDGLYCKPYEADKRIDPFADTKGSADCIGSSSGLSNSQGGLCLNDQQKQLLLTRGGNAAAPDSQIGH
jgi:hypothetical protein